MDDIISFSALEIETNLDKYFNSLENLEVTDIQDNSSTDNDIDESI